MAPPRLRAVPAPAQHLCGDVVVRLGRCVLLGEAAGAILNSVLQIVEPRAALLDAPSVVLGELGVGTGWRGLRVVAASKQVAEAAAEGGGGCEPGCKGRWGRVVGLGYLGRWLGPR